jgi:protein tyrosine/serine phosphatase
MRRHLTLLWLVAGLALGCVSTRPGPRLRLGLPNFDEVEAGLYRGGQPTAAGFQALSAMGVATVVDLRRAGERPPTRAAERTAVEGLGLAYLPLRLSPIAAPRREAAERLLAALTEARRRPVFVHCKRGADRTGTAIALYRISRDCWSAEEAIREARSHGMAWFEFGMRRFIRDWHRRIGARSCVPVGDEPAARPLVRFASAFEE